MIVNVLTLVLCTLGQPETRTPPPASTPSPSNIGDQPPKTDSGPALAKFSSRDQALITKQARWCFRIPARSSTANSNDETKHEQVWNGAAYAEFRSVLAEYDSTSKGRPLSGRVTAWGFTEKNRWPDSKNRPAPLWECTDSKRSAFTPFVYVNTALLSAKEKKEDATAARVEKVYLGVEDGGAKIVQMKVREYPHASDFEVIGRLPLSWANGYAHGLVKIPAGMKVQEGEGVDGEFLLVADDSYERPKGAPDSMPRYRFEYASAARLSADELAQAVLDNKARVVEWKFKRESRAGEEKVQWEREEVKTP